MLVGLYLRLFGRATAGAASPSWATLRQAAIAAETAGFDRVVFEDVLLYPGEDGDDGLWDPISMAAAVAASTARIGIGHSVINNPYHHPAIIARAAATLDEISGGRYSLGIGLGNTPDDYPRFGIAADRRYTRFAESIEVIASLLRTGSARLEGEFVRVPEGALVLRGPRPQGPPIVIAAGKPRMLRLAARYADEWNWWTADPANAGSLAGLVEELERGCEEVGRDPTTISRSIDLFSISPPHQDASPDGDTAPAIAERILAWQTLGFGEARLNLRVPDGASLGTAVEAMSDVVSLVHRG